MTVYVIPLVLPDERIREFPRKMRDFLCFITTRSWHYCCINRTEKVFGICKWKMMSRGIQHRISGFTLVELMIVVAIIGLLAAIAIPAFSRYIRKARTSEAVGHLNKEWAGSLMYYEADHTVAFGRILTKEFPGPSAGWASATECGCMTGAFCPANNPIWNSDLVWKALSFSLPDPHHYMPGYSATGTGSSAQFTAYAKGDLNCNHILSEFSRQGIISSHGDVTGSQLPTLVNELE